MRHYFLFFYHDKFCNYISDGCTLTFWDGCQNYLSTWVNIFTITLQNVAILLNTHNGINGDIYDWFDKGHVMLNYKLVLQGYNETLHWINFKGFSE